MLAALSLDFSIQHSDLCFSFFSTSRFLCHSFFILYSYYYYSSRVFHISISWWFIHWGLSDSKSPQVSRTRLSILAVLSNAVVWIVSTRPPTSKSSRPFNNPLATVPNAPITIGTIVTFMFYSFFNSLARSKYVSFFSHSFRFILWSAGTTKSTILQILFLLLIIMRSGLLAGIRWSVCMLKSHKSLFESFSRTGCAYTICLYGRIEISCTFPSWSPCRPSRVSPCTPSVLICCIRW